MKTPNTVSSLTLLTDASQISMRQLEKYMEGTTKANGRLIRKHIKEHLPALYADLALNFYNPYEQSCVKKEGLLVYVHSSTEYFLKFKP